MPPITMETLLKYPQFQNDNRALNLGVRRGAEERENVKRGMGGCVRFRFRKQRSLKIGGKLRVVESGLKWGPIDPLVLVLK